MYVDYASKLLSFPTRDLAVREQEILQAAEAREQDIERLSRERETSAAQREKALSERERDVEAKERSLNLKPRTQTQLPSAPPANNANHRTRQYHQQRIIPNYRQTSESQAPAVSPDDTEQVGSRPRLQGQQRRRRVRPQQEE